MNKPETATCGECERFDTCYHVGQGIGIELSGKRKAPECFRPSNPTEGE